MTGTTPADNAGSGTSPAAPAPAAKSAGSTSSASGRAGQHGETPISSFSFARRHPFDYTKTVLMPFQVTGSFTPINSDTSANNTKAYTFRLNSIYDVMTGNQGYIEARLPPLADQVAVSEPPPMTFTNIPDGSIQTPMYREYWKNLYRYWTVVGSRYIFRAWTDSTSSSSQAVSLHVYHHGKQAPPMYRSVGGTNKISDFFRRQHDGHRHYYLYNRLTGDFRHARSNAVEVRGHYKPGSIHHEVLEDELAQTWHQETEVPPTEEMVTFMFQKPDHINAFTSACDWSMEMEFIVQWKDLRFTHQYITEDSAIPAIAAYGQQSNTAESAKTVPLEYT